MRFVPVARPYDGGVLQLHLRNHAAAQLPLQGSLQDWRMHACCVAGNPLVRALGKLLFDSRVRQRYRQ